MNVEQLEWDSEFWNINIGQVVNFDDSQWNTSHDILKNYNVIQAAVPIGDFHNAHSLSRLGFFPVDSRIEFEKRVSKSNSDFSNSVNGDIWNNGTQDDMLIEHYANAFAGISRFQAFPVAKSSISGFYRTWIEKSIRGEFDDILVTLQTDDQQIGLFSMKHILNKSKIGLFAVHTNAQGKHFSQSLLNKIMEYATVNESETIGVVTSGANIAARRTYQKGGYYPISEHLWMYWINESN
ncbi:GNAT family N-acetyltransferase [Gemmatimonadota bacterium]